MISFWIAEKEATCDKSWKSLIELAKVMNRLGLMESEVVDRLEHVWMMEYRNECILSAYGS